MAYDSTGTYTAPSGSETAQPGNTLLSATWNNIFTDLSTALNSVGKGTVTNAMVPVPGLASSYFTAVQSVNFAASAGDIASFAIPLPVSISNYKILAMKIGNAGASLGTVNVNLYTAALRTGTIIISSTATTITTSLANAVNSAQVMTPASVNITMFKGSPIFLSVSISNAASSTADVVLQIEPVY